MLIDRWLGGQQPSFPNIATAYSAVVSANFLDKGYTLSYNEHWDGARNKLRTDGRFLPTDYSELIDFNTEVLYRWVPDDVTRPCVALNISNSAGVIMGSRFRGAPLLQPSRVMFQALTGTTVRLQTAINPLPLPLRLMYVFNRFACVASLPLRFSPMWA